MMTNERQVTVYHLDTRRQDRRFHPYRRPVGYDRFTSVPQISAERQWLMSFIVVSRRGVLGTSHGPLSTLWFWPQEETARRILCRSSYFQFIRRNRRHHPYQRSEKYSSGLCKCCSLPVYLDCRYFSLSARRYFDNTEASTTAATNKEIECLAVDNQMKEKNESSKDNHLHVAQITQDVQLTMIKTSEMTTLELDKPTSDDVSDPNNTEIPVTDSMTDWDLNLLTDSDLQQMRKTACDTTVADLGSSGESKTNSDVTHTHVDHKQVSNVTLDDQLATTNVSTKEAPEVQQIPQQNKAPVIDSETAVTNEIYEKQHENDKIDTETKKRDNEDDCHKMKPTEEKLLNCGQSSNVSPVDHLEKTREEMYDKKSVEKNVMDETHKANGTAESTVRCIIHPKACRKRMSVAMFFQKEISHSDTRNTTTCIDFNLASSSITKASGLTCYESRKSHCQQAQIADAEIHSSNSLCIWLRKSSSSSEPNNATKKLSDEERLKMRKRRFGITAQSEEKSTKNLKRDMSGSAPPVVTKRRKIRLNRY